MAKKTMGKPIVPSLADTISWTVCLILFLTMLATFKGVYLLHLQYGDAVFGSTNSSLALLAVGVNAALFGKFAAHCFGGCCGNS